MSDTSAHATGSPSRGRSIAAVICLVVGALLTTPAAVAFWGQRTLNDTQRYVETVGPLVDSAEVQDAVATKVIEAIEKRVDVESLLDEAFAGVIDERPRLELLIGPLAGAVNSLIDSQVRAFVASDTFRDLWMAANTKSQQVLLRVLKGDSTGAVSLQDDQVVLDVSEVIDAVQQRLVDRGLTMLEKVPTPDQDRQIVLMDAPQLKDLRTIYAFGNPVATWLLPFAAALLLGAFVLSRRRARMTVAIAGVLVANSLLVAVSLSIGRQLFVNNLSGTVFGPASTVFYDTLLSYLERGQDVMLWLGLLLAVAGWFAGSTTSGAAVRRTVAGGLESVGSALAPGPVGRAGTWVGSNVRWLRVVVGLVGVVVLLWGLDVSLSRLAWSTVLVVVALALLQVLVGAGRATTGPGATTGPAADDQASADAAADVDAPVPV